MDRKILEHLANETASMREAGLFKSERVIVTPQGAAIRVGGGQQGQADSSEVLNFCANNYLGLASHPRLVEAARRALSEHGYGMASVRFICGTQDVHKSLERRIASFLGTEDCILYSSCWDANGGLFETILGQEDAVVSDALNHASIIDGVRLCKAQRYRYANNDMKDLEAKLVEARANGARHILIATDGVFSMDGYLANLGAICDLADRYDALTMVDDSHAVGFIGEKGRGTPEHCGVVGRVDVVTGTLGKALGGASGGYTAARREIVDILRQRSRPYLFSNTLAPVIAATSLEVLDMLEESDDLRVKLRHNATRFRAGMTKLGFRLLPGEHPIIPVMFGDAKLAGRMADAMLEEGVYVVGFSYPVVPKGEARIRAQMSAAHDDTQIDRAVAAFAKVGRAIGVISLKALVKAKRELGIWLDEQPEPEVGPNDVKIRIHKTAICGTDIHIYNWDEWAQTTIPVPMTIGHEFAGEVVDVGSHVRRLRRGRPGQRRGPHHVRPLPQLPRGKAAPVPQHDRRRRARPGCFAEYIVIPAAQRVQATGQHPRRHRVLPRSARQRHAHRAQLRPRGGGRARSPAQARSAAWLRRSRSTVGARHVVITDVNPYRLELARKMGASRALDAHARLDRRCDEEARHDRGLRRRPRDERQRTRVPRPAREHEPRRARRDPGHPAEARSRSTGTRSSSRASCSRASTAARCSRPGTR